MAAAIPDSRPAVAFWTTLGAVTIVIVTFIVDLILPLGYAGAMPYVIAVVLGLWAPTGKLALATATASTLLALVAIPLEGRSAVPAYLWALNRTVALTAIWAVAFAVVRYKSFERRVREEQTKTQVILDTSADGLITIDERGTIELFNGAAERIFGFTQEEVLGKNLSLLMPSPHRERHERYLQRYLQTGEAHVIGSGREVEGLRRDGSVFPMDLAVAEVKLDHRRLFTGSVRDITARKQAERERESLIRTLEQKNTELERFTYTVSHDLKSPLVTIKGFLGSLERSARDGNLERLTADVARISAAADRMKQLLDELLELSRIGRVASPPVELPLAELAREATDSLAGLSSERGATIEIASDLPVVRGDRTRLVEVLQNLIENALKFAGQTASPRVEIGARSDDGETVIFVRDNGMGIDVRYKEKIFGLFEKLDKSQAGTGVGLALVKRIVEVHGGRVWVESEGPGMGACFCFTLAEPPTQPRSAA